MNSENKWLSFGEARQTDMIDYLSKLGHEPVKVRNCNYWYLSPLQKEKTASFKVNKELNKVCIGFGLCDVGELKYGNFKFSTKVYKNY